jgi:hypothetical protein
MSMIPTIDTLIVVAGIGGWVGAWHAMNLYLHDGPIMIDRALKMLALPVIWSGGSVVFTVSVIGTLNFVSFVYNAMVQPLPLVMNFVISTGIAGCFIGSMLLGHAFRTVAETAAAEMAADREEDAHAEAEEAEEAEVEEAEEAEVEEEAEEEADETADDNESVRNEMSESQVFRIPQVIDSDDNSSDDSEASAPHVSSSIPLTPTLTPPPPPPASPPLLPMDEEGFVVEN